MVNLGDECGEFVYIKIYGFVIIMWKDCGCSNEW